MIESVNLTKRFGQKVAVDDISFTVGPGEVLGFLGPNAAGKSTTMRMITGYLPPTSGTARIGGNDIVEQSLSARRRIGYLPENAPIYPDMTVIAFLDFIAEIRGFTGRAKTVRIADTLERCFLSGARFQTINTLSKGFKQRVCFAQSILHDPEYLIMDEPTDGLDPNQKHEVRDMIREMARDKTIIISTHSLEEVDEVCTRAIIIADGRIVIDDTPERLKARSSVHGAFCMTMVRRPEDGDLLLEVRQVPGVKEAELVDQRDERVIVRVHPSDVIPSVIDRMIRHFLDQGRPVESLFVEEGRLDEVFRTLTIPDSGEAGR